MNREQAKELAKVVAAWAEGKTVQALETSGWRDVDNPSFDAFFSWRIKPEPKRTAGYRTYYFQGSEEIMLTQVWGDVPPSEILRIENSEGFIKWKHTEWQYDDVEVE